MVFYFICEIHDPPLTIYLGEDKFANEELIRYGFPEDVWFHVDGVSSAHVYLRLPSGMGLDDIPHDVLVDCAQLTKANSISGCKQDSIKIVYTPWTNLHKTGDMEVGQIGFHRKSELRYITVKKRNEIVKRLDKTRTQGKPNLKLMREERDEAERMEKKQIQKEEREREKAEMKERALEKEAKSYKSLMDPKKMETNKELATRYQDYEDNFM